MASIQIWPGAKWAVAGLSGLLSTVTIPATKNQLGAWKQKGWITFHDDPSISPSPQEYDQQAEFYGGLIANWTAYLFSKAMAVYQTFPSFLMFTAVQVNILPAFYDYMRNNIKTILKIHLGQSYQWALDIGVLSYCTFISMWTSELSKFPLL